MTAQIVIMNRAAVALASDSAVSTGDKIYNSANKIFSISKSKPVGVMIYNHANFLGIPWETLIKMFRNHIVYEEYDSLKEYGEAFIDFLNSGVISQELIEQHIKYKAINFLNAIADSLKGNDLFKLKTTSEGVDSCYEYWKEVNYLNASTTDADVISFEIQYSEMFRELISNICEMRELTQGDITKLVKALCQYFYSDHVLNDNYSGIVFTGFGEKDMFPSTLEYKIFSFTHEVRYFYEGIQIIDGITDNSSIMPFAERDMVDRYVAGFDPGVKELSLNLVKNLLDGYIDEVKALFPSDLPLELIEKLKQHNEASFNTFNDQVEDYQNEHFFTPIHDIVRSLPHDELANMAETLVNLSSFKRKVTKERDTVGGPIDVAVITKGDGFIWIKRKHYFSPELNPHFFKR